MRVRDIFFSWGISAFAKKTNEMTMLKRNVGERKIKHKVKMGQ